MEHQCILYIGGFDLPDRNAAAQRVISNAKLFRDLGYTVVLVGLDKEIIQSQKIIYEGFDCINLKYPRSKQEWLDYTISFSIYKEYIERYSPSIIIAYNHPGIALKRLLNYCHNKRIKLLSDCTEWYETRGNGLFRLIKGFDIWYRMKIVHPQLDGIITISSFLQSFYEEYSSKLKLLQLPPLVDKQDPKWMDALNKKDNNKKSINFIYAGSPGNKDRLDVVISVMKDILDKYQYPWSLKIIGIGSKDFYNIYGVEAPKSSFVQFLGRLPHTEVLSLLANSDYQIFIRENNRTNLAGFPTKFVESISLGVFVLTNMSSNLNDYLIEGKNGYELEINNYDTLYHSLMKVSKIDKKTILTKKTTIEVNTFDYRKYLDKTKDFLESI